MQFLSALMAIIVIDLVLAGDNAIVIALAARKLPPHLQTKAIVWGTVGAIVVRTAMAPIAPQMIARFCSAGGRLRAARAITMALSPASTRSITTMASSAERKVAGSIRSERGVGCVRFCGARARRDSRFVMHCESRSINDERETSGASGDCTAATMAARAVPRGPACKAGVARVPAHRDVRFVVNTGHEAPASRVPSGMSKTFAIS